MGHQCQEVEFGNEPGDRPLEGADGAESRGHRCRHREPEVDDEVDELTEQCRRGRPRQTVTVLEHDLPDLPLAESLF